MKNDKCAIIRHVIIILYILLIIATTIYSSVAFAIKYRSIFEGYLKMFPLEMLGFSPVYILSIILIIINIILINMKKYTTALTYASIVYIISLSRNNSQSPYIIILIIILGVFLESLAIKCAQKNYPLVHTWRCSWKCKVLWVTSEAISIGLILGVIFLILFLFNKFTMAIGLIAHGAPPDTRFAVELMAYSPLVRLTFGLILLSFAWIVYERLIPLIYVFLITKNVSIRIIINNYIKKLKENIKNGKEWHIKFYAIFSSMIAGEAFLTPFTLIFTTINLDLSNQNLRMLLKYTILVTVLYSIILYIFYISIKKFIIDRNHKYMLIIFIIMLIILFIPLIKVNKTAYIFSITRDALVGHPPRQTPIDNKFTAFVEFNRLIAQALRIIIR